MIRRFVLTAAALLIPIAALPQTAGEPFTIAASPPDDLLAVVLRLGLRDGMAPETLSGAATDVANCRIQYVVVDLDRFERLSRSPTRGAIHIHA